MRRYAAGVWVKRFVTLVCVLGVCAAASASAGQMHGVVSVNKAGTGDGKVTSSPPGIDCDPVCASSFPGPGEPGYQSTIVLTATPFAGSTFDGWSGCDDSVGANC